MLKLPILDESGKVHEWLRSGRGVVVWESHDIGAGRPDVFSPADHVTDEKADATHDRCVLLDCKPIVGEAPPVGEQRAPSCRKPHWAYMPGRILRSEDDALFFNPGRIVKSWSETHAGGKAAQRALAKYTDEEREAPIGTVYTTYTLHHYAMVAARITPEGTVLDTYGPPLAGGSDKRTETDVCFRVGIREWSCVKRATKVEPLAS